MKRDLDTAEIATLEQLIDSAGVDSVLMALSDICGLKAEHIADNWQDATLAREWATLEGAIGVIVPKAIGL